MSGLASFGLNALAVALTGGAATLTTWQTNGHLWVPALVTGGVVLCVTGGAQLARHGITARLSGGPAGPAPAPAGARRA